MNQPPTDEQLAQIEAVVRNAPLIGADIDPATAAVLLAEVHRLRAELVTGRQEVAAVFRAEFGEFAIRRKDGDWANVADWIATGARIPQCGDFYPHHTDTRCTRAKGHRGSHKAPWGTRDMAWPPTIAAAEPDPICGDENDGDWCELEPGHGGHHRADTAEWGAAPAASAVSSATENGDQ